MFKILMRSVILGVSLLFVFSAVAVATAKEYQEIDAKAVKLLMDQDAATVVFPLSPIEFNNLHIKDSVNIPMDQLESALPKDKSRKLVFYCLGVTCVASWRGAERAVDLGYKNVYAFREGLPGWVAAGYPTVTIDKLPEVVVRSISTTDLADKLAKESVVLIDVNLEVDARKFHIDHAKRVHIPMDELHLKTSTLNKDQQIVVICLKGNRSEIAARYLIGKGFKDVVIVKGGLQQWVLEGRPIKQAS